jgi:hypothetical protein
LRRHDKPHISLRSHTGRSFLDFRISRRFVKNTAITIAASSLVSLMGLWWMHARDDSLRGGIGRGFELQEGPWGRIDAKSVLIKPPADAFDPDFKLGNGIWYFEKTSPHALSGILRDCGLTQEQAEAAIATLEPVPNAPDLVSIDPPRDLVLSLDPETRSRPYSRLARLEANFAQAQPFRMRADHLEDWLGTKALDPELATTIRKLLWRSGDTLLFSDYNLVAAGIPDPAARVELQRNLAQKVSLFATLDVPAGSNVEDLVKYWGFGGREEGVRPILEAASAAGGAQVGIVNLLPPFAREHLNRFPARALLEKDPPACHWSTFNFFTHGTPDDSFHTAAGVEQEIRKNYTKLGDGERPRFGDIVLLNEPGDSSIHSAVVIAGDIVFTKNGPSAATPWVLSTTSEMKAFYPVGMPLTAAYFRRRRAE